MPKKIKRFAVGDSVVLSTPDNPTADGNQCVVEFVTDWGYHLTTEFGSRNFRALWEEVDGAEPTNPAVRREPVNGNAAGMLAAKASGYTGDTCSNCQGIRMTRNGGCQKCEDCGTTTGCS